MKLSSVGKLQDLLDGDCSGKLTFILDDQQLQDLLDGDRLHLLHLLEIRLKRLLRSGETSREAWQWLRSRR